jgi:VanZ family protein
MLLQIFAFVKLAHRLAHRRGSLPGQLQERGRMDIFLGKMSVKNLYLRSLRHRILYTAGAAVFGLFLLYICTRPHSILERWHYPDISDLFDAANHFIGFTFFNFLVLSALLSVQYRQGVAVLPSRQNIRAPSSLNAHNKHTAALLLAVGLPWGFICEFLQLFIPSRSFQLMDIAANTLPSLLVSFIFKMKMKNMYKKI